MRSDVRVRELAVLASGLALGCGQPLPASLQLWSLAGGRPDAEPVHADDPARALGAALERALSPSERAAGAHYTPGPAAARVAALALDGVPDRPTVVDPACGGGALLLAAADRLADGGAPRAVVARDLLWAADVDPVAVAVTEAVLALWSGGEAPAPGHVVVGDTLRTGASAWTDPPAGGFDVVVGNPPFQGQLARRTARTAPETAALRARFGDAVSTYVDTAALFLLVGVALARPGGRVALVQPQSTVASRDAGPVRAALAEHAALVDLWAPRDRLFEANVHVCVPVLETGRRDADGAWHRRLAAARGIPPVSLGGARTVQDLAAVIAGFRDEYYALVPHVREAAGATSAPLVTSGLVDIGSSAWGARPVRFAKRPWARPEVDLDGLRATTPRVGAWVDRVRRPKVVVASQTRVLEAAPDEDGTWVPATPLVSVVPEDPTQVLTLAAVLCSPPVSAWAAGRAAGTGLSPDAIRVSAPLLAVVPLPDGTEAWAAASRALAEGDLPAFARAATAMYLLPPAEADAVLSWWSARAKLTWPPPDGLR